MQHCITYDTRIIAKKESCEHRVRYAHPVQEVSKDLPPIAKKVAERMVVAFPMMIDSMSTSFESLVQVFTLDVVGSLHGEHGGLYAEPPGTSTSQLDAFKVKPSGFSR